MPGTLAVDFSPRDLAKRLCRIATPELRAWVCLVVVGPVSLRDTMVVNAYRGLKSTASVPGMGLN